MLRITRRALLGSALATPALAQSDLWPNRPIRLIVAFAAGGAADTAARTVGQKLQEIIGQSVIIENRTGGNAVIAANATLQSPRDGYTFLVDAANQLTNPPLMKDLGFDYRTAFLPVSQVCLFPQVIAVKQDFPARTIEEFIAAAKARPATISYGTPPAAGMGHLAGEMFQKLAGIRLIHTPYRGGADAARDITAGVIDAVLITTNSIRPPVQSGKARMLAVTSLNRVPSIPEVPPLAEKGFPGFDMNDWNGVFAAAGTPTGIVVRLAEALGQACRDAGVKQRMDPLGAVMSGSSPEEFARWLDGQRMICEQVIREAGITLG
ncbi:twin-arginine translocation pathway signal protein [Siccirubricoccus sp. KC 17139]|uniref:Twin-arginine translocation pathway signal protein n=1 Tax=Siccirubricoccus soli TaxID=2899147 RepID=A0ABT1D7F9_9PROT|nr:tripartite tricarboxylate transporter substrate-binding protein [Siccirubricoccus soli]MCO6417814.1 twin-arginine translocation pathway signal protein [Siccirubricoccus soli]MCP2683949.1 tripartite tricarboxylate transporter substrate-binding protein [Siccirubricoccus soli]